jgi:hypothetical protein
MADQGLALRLRQPASRVAQKTGVSTTVIKTEAHRYAIR